jgi:nitroimidazol reductase NimA-like FMN-containing flavoprotein (pyridoxamine 5'-phosphate oxidase superfamily)
MSTDEEPMVELTIEECWELLELEEFGRMAYRLVDEMHQVPINYVTDAGTLLFCTASGNKLLAAALHSEVSFEIDWHDDAAAWSVVLRGRLQRVPENEAHLVDDLPVQPWVAAEAFDVIRLVPEVVTGRRFRLRDAGLRDRPGRHRFDRLELSPGSGEAGQV